MNCAAAWGVFKSIEKRVIKKNEKCMRENFKRRRKMSENESEVRKRSERIIVVKKIKERRKI